MTTPLRIVIVQDYPAARQAILNGRADLAILEINSWEPDYDAGSGYVGATQMCHVLSTSTLHTRLAELTAMREVNPEGTIPVFLYTGDFVHGDPRGIDGTTAPMLVQALYFLI